MRIKKPIFFQATWGDVTTNTPYRRPTLEAFTKWWLDFKDINGLEHYDIWLVGSFCEKIFGEYKGYPRDVDVVITGDIVDEENLYYILQHAVKKGFENRLLIDISWATTISNKHLPNWTPFCKIRVGKTFTKILGEHATVIDYKADDEKRMDCGAWSFCFQEPPNSWFKTWHRYEEGQYKGLCMDLREMFE